jgi:hypothetical protein
MVFYSKIDVKGNKTFSIAELSLESLYLKDLQY